jgi:hypothetical protein
MATAKSEVMQFEFTERGSVLGRATWLGPGMVELDFHDKSLRQRFMKWFDQPQDHLDNVFEPNGGLDTFWRDQTRNRFAEACWTMSNYYEVRRIA